MKKLLSIFLFIVIFQGINNAQCKIKAGEIILKYVKKGIVLMHESYNNKKDKPYKIVFSKDITYGIYLLNPSDSLPDLTLFNTKTNQIIKCNKEINIEDNYAFYKFTIKESGQYKIKLDFKTKNKACVLFVLTFIGKETSN